jgi:hypothetical protein
MNKVLTEGDYYVNKWKIENSAVALKNCDHSMNLI